MLPCSSSKMKLVLSFLLLDYVFSEDTLSTKGSDEYIPCDKGWYYFREKCFKAVGKKEYERVNWFQAERHCKNEGGFLVGIRSQEDLDFIMTFLLMNSVKTHVYIGLNDQAEEGVYVWNDGSPATFTKWRWGEPTGVTVLDEDCTIMVYDPGQNQNGLWNDVACSDRFGYACHKNTNEEKKTPNPMFCVSNGKRGVNYKSSCYHVVAEKESWQAAEEHCKYNYNGHLVTILNLPEDTLLDYLLLSNNDTDIWIGINIEGQTEPKWTSGWYMSYNGLSINRGQRKGTCAVRKKRKEWLLVPCDDKYSFVCERSEVIAPVLKSTPNSHCPEVADGWKDLGGEYCYFVETQSRINWYEAKFDCTRRGGNLVSIHSKEEKDVLLPFVISQYKPIHLGFLRMLNKEFAWADGSERDYQNWSLDEPNDPEKKCSEISHKDASWNDADCKDKKAYICSVRKIVQATTKAEETTVTTVTRGSTKVDDFTVFAVNQNGTQKVSEITDSGDLVLKFVIGLSVCIAVVVFLLILMVYYCRQWALERRKETSPVRVTPPPTWTIPSRRWDDDGYMYRDRDDDGYIYRDRDDELYEIVRICILRRYLTD